MKYIAHYSALIVLAILITACGDDTAANVTPSTAPIAAQAKANDGTAPAGCGSSTKDGSTSKGSTCKCKVTAAPAPAVAPSQAPVK